MKKKILLFFSILLSCISITNATIRYVHPTQSGMYSTIPDAITAASAGDTILLVDSIDGGHRYDIASGTILDFSKVLTLVSQQSTALNQFDTISKTTGIGEDDLLRIHSNLTIIGIRFEWTNTTTDAGKTLNSYLLNNPWSDNFTITIKKCSFYKLYGLGSRYNGIRLTAANAVFDSCLFLNVNGGGTVNTFSNSLFKDVSWYAKSDNKIINCLSYNTIASGGGENHIAGSRIVVNNCFIYDNNSGARPITMADAGTVKRNDTITNTVIYGCSQSPLRLDTVYSSFIKNNIFTTRNGNMLYNSGTYTSDSVNFYNNTYVATANDISFMYLTKTNHHVFNNDLFLCSNTINVNIVTGGLYDSINNSVFLRLNGTPSKTFTNIVLQDTLETDVVDMLEQSRYFIPRQNIGNKIMQKTAGAHGYLTNKNDTLINITTRNIKIVDSIPPWFRFPNSEMSLNNKWFKGDTVNVVTQISTDKSTWVSVDSVKTGAGDKDTTEYTAPADGTYYYRLIGKTYIDTIFYDTTMIDSVIFTSGGGEPKTPAVITVQPQNVTKATGDNATFSVTATGENLTYQWYRNNTLMSGEDSSSFTFTTSNGLNGAPVFCLLTTDTTISTDTATLTLTTVAIDNSIDTILLVADISGATGYQWYKDSVAIDGATNSTYQVIIDDAGYTLNPQYYCLAWNGSGDTVSTKSWFFGTGESSKTPAVVTAQPQSITKKSGETASFSVTATGSGLTYQWYGNNSLIPGATSSTYSFTAAKIYNGTQVWCLLTTDTTISTDTAVLTVTDMTIDQTTDSLILHIPSDPLFTGQQWYEHDTAITGATALRFVVEADSAAYANKNYYYCKVWNTVNDTVQSGTWQLGLQPSGTKQKRWFGFKTGAFIGAWR